MKNRKCRSVRSIIGATLRRLAGRLVITVESHSGNRSKMVHDTLHRHMSRLTAGNRLVVDPQLLVCARTSLCDDGCMLDFCYTSVMVRIIVNHLDELPDEHVERLHFPVAKIDQLAVGAVAHCPPAVLRNQHRRIIPPRLIARAQPPQQLRLRGAGAVSEDSLRIGSCDDFQAVIPDYLARRLTQARTLCGEVYRRVWRTAETYVLSELETANGPLPEAAPSFYRRFGGLTPAPLDAREQ